LKHDVLELKQLLAVALHTHDDARVSILNSKIRDTQTDIQLVESNQIKSSPLLFSHITTHHTTSHGASIMPKLTTHINTSTEAQETTRAKARKLQMVSEQMGPDSLPESTLLWKRWQSYQDFSWRSRIRDALHVLGTMMWLAAGHGSTSAEFQVCAVLDNSGPFRCPACSKAGCVFNSTSQTTQLPFLFINLHTGSNKFFVGNGWDLHNGSNNSILASENSAAEFADFFSNDQVLALAQCMAFAYPRQKLYQHMHSAGFDFPRLCNTDGDQGHDQARLVSHNKSSSVTKDDQLIIYRQSFETMMGRGFRVSLLPASNISSTPVVHTASDQPFVGVMQGLVDSAVDAAKFIAFKSPLSQALGSIVGNTKNSMGEDTLLVKGHVS
jgi:hypothetical protein